MGDYLGEVVDQRLSANHPLKPLVSLEFNSGENHVEKCRRESSTCISIIGNGNPGLVDLHRDANALPIHWMQTGYQRSLDADVPRHGLVETRL